MSASPIKDAGTEGRLGGMGLSKWGGIGVGLDTVGIVEVLLCVDVPAGGVFSTGLASLGDLAGEKESEIAPTLAETDAPTDVIAPTPKATVDGVTSISEPDRPESAARVAELTRGTLDKPAVSVLYGEIVKDESAMDSDDRSGYLQAIRLNGTLFGIAFARKKFGVRDRQGRDGGDAVGQCKLAGSVKDIRALSLN